MKILLVNKFFHPRGGTETYMFSLASLLSKNEHELIGFSQKNKNNIKIDGEEFFIEEMKLDKFYKQNIFKIGRIFWSFKSAKKIKQLIETEKPDIVHIHNIYHQISPSILPTIKKTGTPIVMTVHDFKLISPNYTLWATKDKQNNKSIIARIFMRLEYLFHKTIKVYEKNVDLFITPSKFVKNELIKSGFKSNKIVVLPHFTETNIQKSASEKNYITYFGRLDKSKGIDTLIKAFSEIKTDATLKVIGSGPMEKELRDLALNLKTNHKIEFIAHCSKNELNTIISDSMFNVFPSLVHETFGLGIIESYLLGKPVIASRVGAFSENVNKETGILVTPGSQNELKEALIKLINDTDLRRLMGQNANAFAKNKFTAKDHYQKMIKTYNTLMSAKKTLYKKGFNGTGKIVLTIAFLTTLIPLVGSAYALPNHTYPRTANLYWKTPITMAETKILAKWDILVLDMKAQIDSAAAIKRIRQINPSIIILAYTTANEVPKERLSIMEPNGTGLWHDLISGIDPRWYLKTYKGENITYWPGNLSMNQYIKNNKRETYNDYLVNFYDKRVLSTGLWDGLLFDNIWDSVTWVNKDIDIDGDGKRDNEFKINQLWKVGNQELFKKLRNRFGDKYLFIGNGDGSYSQYLNGRMFESFPEFWEGGWSSSMQRYWDTNQNGYQPRINIINADSDNTGKYIDSSRMRYGFTSTLMYNGYYSFDWSTSKRENFWWYDEFDVNLGKPKSTPINLLDKTNGLIQNSVWQRDFENGVAIVNSTAQKQTIYFDSEYEKVKSAQNPSINNGSRINQLSLMPHDGTILLRPISEIFDTAFSNGSFARIFNRSGDSIRSGFFSYNSKFRGDVKIAKIDLDGGGRVETITADKSKIEVFSSYGFKKFSFYPYGKNYTLGISIDFADIDHDGKKEIITGTENGGSNEIKIFNHRGELIRSWYAYNKKWVNLGVNVAAGDINGDGEIEIITGAGYRGGPHVKIFNQYGNTLLNEFFSYEFDFRGGTYVATGDLNGDGIDEIITGAGPGGTPTVKVFNGNGTLQKEWLAYSSRSRSGVEVTTADVDNNGIDEIIALTTSVFTLSSIK